MKRLETRLFDRSLGPVASSCPDIHKLEILRTKTENALDSFSVSQVIF